MSHERPDFDVGIIGGGPAGASLAAYLGKAGVSCVVFERETFPRPHVGESLVPSSTRVFKELGFLPTMEGARFPHKLGAVWTADNGALYDHGWDGLATDCRADIRFDEREQPGVDQNHTYHVDRGRFDELLLRHAERLGAVVYEATAVRDVVFDAPEFVELKFAVGNTPGRIRVRLLADASGRRTFLGSRLKLKMMDEVFDQYAIHTWFDGYDRGTPLAGHDDKRDYIFVHFLPVTNSWMWQIPITDSITSIGVVTQKKHFMGSRASREQFFWNCTASRPELHEALLRSQQVRPFTEEGDYSYAMRQICGDRFVMLGDAARFVDPIFSTGVSIALNSARFASRDIIAALQTTDLSRAAFANYETTIRRGTRNWYNFISLYYRLNVLFTAFIKHPRYRLDVLKLLQGDVYDEDEPMVLTKMRDIVSAIESNESHPLHERLGELTANAFRPTF